MTSSQSPAHDLDSSADGQLTGDLYLRDRPDHLGPIDRCTWNSAVIIIVAITLTIGYRILKERRDKNRLLLCNLSVTVVGAGPVGLCNAIAIIRCPKVKQLVLYEQRTSTEMTRRLQQIAIDTKTRNFLKTLDIDFNGMEGELRSGYFYTRCEVLTDYLITKINTLRLVPGYPEIEIITNTKFTPDLLTIATERSRGQRCRHLVVVCDGHEGQTARTLGVGDEFRFHSCKAYGAMANFDRLNVSSVSTPEVRVHNLNFDLSAYGYHQTRKQKDMQDRLSSPGASPRCHHAGCSTSGGVSSAPATAASASSSAAAASSVQEVGGVCDNPAAFHLKLTGTARNRSFSLAVRRHSPSEQLESPVVKTLKVVLDQGIMRNLFRVCYNTYRPQDEQEITDILAVRCMRFNPRLFEIRLSQRIESAIYIVEENCFVITEGEASLWLNFRTGMDINLALSGLFKIRELVENATTADTDDEIIQVILSKMSSTRSIVNEYVKHGFFNVMFT